MMMLFFTRICTTSSIVLPLTGIPLTSCTSSPVCTKPKVILAMLYVYIYNLHHSISPTVHRNLLNKSL